MRVRNDYFTKKINSIICDYNLDGDFPNFLRQQKAAECLERMVEEKIQNGNSLHFVYQNEKDWLAVDYMMRGKKEITHGKYDADIPDNAEIYSLAFSDSLEVLSSGMKFTNIYDYFAEQGALFEEEWYCIGGPYSDFNISSMIYKDNNGVNLCPLQIMYLRRDAEQTVNIEDKKRFLRDALFLALYIKDFITAKALIDSYELIDGDKIYQSLWKDIEAVLLEMQSMIKKRKHRDIIMYWIDAVSYEASVGMPYVRKEIENGICYTNAFTVTENTKPTFKSIFCQKRQVDDRAYRLLTVKKEDATVVNKIVSEGYDFKVFSGYMTSAWLDEAFLSQRYFERNSTCSEVLWNTFENLLLSDRKQFSLSHFLLETHFPYFSADMEIETFENDSERVKTGRSYVDKQLAFYNSLIGNKSTKIYMSDHGLGDFCTKYHVLFNICSECVSPQIMNELISSLDFGTLILKVIRGEAIEDGMLSHEYVQIQDIPAYAKERIRKTLENGWLPEIGYLGHIGVVTKKYIYLKFEDGREWLQDREKVMKEPSFFVEYKDVCDEKILSELREFTGDYPKEIQKEEKFKWYHYWEKYLSNYLKSHPVNESVRLINEYLREKPDFSVAIRSGGEHTLNLLNHISEDNKKKIALIIDNNIECVCSKCGIKIMTEEEYDLADTPYILISSYLYGSKLKEEAKKYTKKGTECTELYEYLRQNNVELFQEFYNLAPLQKDLEVGFQFDS